MWGSNVSGFVCTWLQSRVQMSKILSLETFKTSNEIYVWRKLALRSFYHVDEVIWSRTSTPSVICTPVPGHLWAFEIYRTQNFGQISEFWHFLGQKLGMAYKNLLRKKLEKVLLHFCSLFDSEQENTLLVRWSKDSFKKYRFEGFLRSDPVYGL